MHRRWDQGREGVLKTLPEHTKGFLVCERGHAKEPERHLLWGRVKGVSRAPPSEKSAALSSLLW